MIKYLEVLFKEKYMTEPITLVTGNFGASGLRLKRMLSSGSGFFKPADSDPLFIPGAEIESRGIDTVVKQHVEPMKPAAPDITIFIS